MDAPSPDQRLLTAAELAERLGRPVGAIHRLSSQGRIPKYKFGHRTVLFDPDEVLAALRVEPTPRTPAARSIPGDNLNELVERIARRVQRKK